MIKGAFTKERIIAILRDFICYPDANEEERAVFCRYPQFFGANMMFQSIRKRLKPAGDGKGGTYFGATGCGKTYMMLFLSRLLTLRERETFKNPTIIIIEDRDDLDDQTSELFVSSKRFLHDDHVKSIESRREFKNELGSRVSGGVYITIVVMTVIPSVRLVDLALLALYLPYEDAKDAHRHTGF
jgi:type I restriction enzyme R subunit